MILFSDLGQAVANLRAQKTRTLLTALGIVFGVGSVIGMLAIGFAPIAAPSARPIRPAGDGAAPHAVPNIIRAPIRSRSCSPNMRPRAKSAS